MPSVRLRLRAALVALLALVAAPAAAGDSAVIVLYHRFGENQYPSTNIRLEQFEAHLKELKSSGYTVLPLTEIVSAFAAGRALPDRTVAITIDDAVASVYTRAWPRLKQAGLPFTLFVSTEAHDKRFKDYMTWDQIRELKEAGVTIGNHSVTHGHMVDQTPQQVADEIAASNEHFKAELGETPTLFAYPYGEYASAPRAAAEKAGFKAAFGQHSGVAYAGADRFTLPRFALNEHWGEIGRFREIVNALPLPITVTEPGDTRVTQPNPPSLALTVSPTVGPLAKFACYGPSRTTTSIDEGQRAVKIGFAQPFALGRNRVNCTMPGPDGRWRWWGIQFYVPKKSP
ncbi:MAG: polysaccharide deacetylase family protein [Alphaproteobacteria bacterium]